MRRIDRDMERGEKFMRAMSCLVAVRQIMEEHGYTPSVHRQGWEMLFALITSRRPWDELPDSLSQMRATEELIRWFEEKLGMLRSTLTNLYPDQAKFFFINFKMLEINPVFAVQAILERRNQLKNGTEPDREASREADRAAVELLESRHILDDEAAARLQALLDKAHDVGLDEIPEGMEVDDEAYLEKADLFHAWLKNWREITRAVIKDRRHLRRLGLIGPSKKKQD